MIAQKKIPILIFDTNIFLKGIDINVFKETVYTTPQVIKEIEVLKFSNKNRNILSIIEIAIVKEHLIIKNPNYEYIKRVVKRAEITGDILSLSKVDLELIALALELKETSSDDVILYSNDYSVQNLSSEMKIKFRGIHKKGIMEQKIFELFCPSCNRVYTFGTLDDHCEVCGSKLKRRSKKSEKNNGVKFI